MASQLNSVRESVASIGDAVRAACLIEATSPKAGNVYPGQSFESLHYDHFVAAADILASAMSQTDISVAQRALVACQKTYQATGTNVNLGIVLLITPLVGAFELAGSLEIDSAENHSQWQLYVKKWFDDLPSSESFALFDCIRVMSPGGMGEVDQMDVNDASSQLDDIVAAMKLGADRDRIAHQYANNFRDLFENVVPVVDEHLQYSDDIYSGVADAHLRLLAAAPDSLIARKCGIQVAIAVQTRAQKVDLDDDESRQQFDQFLRHDGNRLNPGTTADLIAAALFVLLINSNKKIVR